MSNQVIKQKILKKGYWRVLIRPSISSYKKDRFKLAELKEKIQECEVRLRGWYYPHFKGEDISAVSMDSFGGSCDWEAFVEYWEFSTSGQFAHIFSILEDQRLEKDPTIAQDIRKTQYFGKDKVEKIEKFIDAISIIYQVTEIFQFAANMAQLEENADVRDFDVDIELHDVKDRMLYLGDPRRGGFLEPYICRFDTNEIVLKNSYKTDDLIGQSDLKACEVILKIYSAFNWTSAQERMVREEQKKLLERRF